MIDSHCHLTSCDQPADELVRAAVTVGVRRLLTVGLEPETSATAIALAEQHDEVWAAVGHHPHEAGSFDDTALERLTELAGHPRCVAIGETGLDRFRDHSSASDQQRAFEAQIDLARAVGKPLVIHTRAADDATISTLAARAEGIDVLLHCFSMADRVDECLEHERWWFSFAGNVTYPSATALASAMERVPDDRLLVETDSPYLTPQPLRGQRNVPANVVETALFVAAARGTGYAELDAQVEANAARLFGW